MGWAITPIGKEIGMKIINKIKDKIIGFLKFMFTEMKETKDKKGFEKGISWMCVAMVGLLVIIMILLSVLIF